MAPAPVNQGVTIIATGAPLVHCVCRWLLRCLRADLEGDRRVARHVLFGTRGLASLQISSPLPMQLPFVNLPTVQEYIAAAGCDADRAVAAPIDAGKRMSSS